RAGRGARAAGGGGGCRGRTDVPAARGQRLPRRAGLVLRPPDAGRRAALLAVPVPAATAAPAGLATGAGLLTGPAPAGRGGARVSRRAAGRRGQIDFPGHRPQWDAARYVPGYLRGRQPMAAISREEVAHLARLSRLAVTD